MLWYGWFLWSKQKHCLFKSFFLTFSACGFQTPYVGSVQDHVENMGPVHDNRCPTPGCEARFSSYAEYQDHATQHGHLGFKCGWCDEVFETMGKSKQYFISEHSFLQNISCLFTIFQPWEGCIVEECMSVTKEYVQPGCPGLQGLPKSLPKRSNVQSVEKYAEIEGPWLATLKWPTLLENFRVKFVVGFLETNLYWGATHMTSIRKKPVNFVGMKLQKWKNIFFSNTQLMKIVPLFVHIVTRLGLRRVNSELIWPFTLEKSLISANIVANVSVKRTGKSLTKKRYMKVKNENLLPVRELLSMWNPNSLLARGKMWDILDMRIIEWNNI